MYRMYGMPRCHGWQGAAMAVLPCLNRVQEFVGADNSANRALMYSQRVLSATMLFAELSAPTRGKKDSGLQPQFPGWLDLIGNQAMLQ